MDKDCIAEEDSHHMAESQNTVLSNSTLRRVVSGRSCQQRCSMLYDFFQAGSRYCCECIRVWMANSKRNKKNKFTYIQMKHHRSKNGTTYFLLNAVQNTVLFSSNSFRATGKSTYIQKHRYVCMCSCP